ncbi:MAG: heavy-metal-associated domain-containing protein [Alistipes sp.]|nr:heavy-metal-associated domain-containing protein [Alistipes sp.]
MKKLILCCILAVMAFAVNAANDNRKDAKTETVVFVTDIDCHHCANKILNNVPVLGKGVEDVKVDVPSKEVTIVYNPEKTNPENLIKGLKKLKVQAQVKPTAEK